jgi:thioredoxin reductase
MSGLTETVNASDLSVREPNSRFDVIVVGSGPAGASAALELGRCRRRTLVIDGGPGRNASSRAAHGLYTRDGTSPAELRRTSQEQLGRYEVQMVAGQAVSARSVPNGSGQDGFEIGLQDGRTFRADKVVLAYGMRDVLPEVAGLSERWGDGVLHCPYCDGWEHQDGRAVVYGAGNAAHHMALTLQPWTRQVTVLTDGPSGFTGEQRQDLSRLGLQVIETRISRLEGQGTRLECVYFEDGSVLAADLMVLSPLQEPSSALGRQLGCVQSGAHVQVSSTGETSVTGVYAAGDLTGGPQYVVSAAAQGTLSAIALNTALIHERLGKRGVEFHKGPTR